MKIISPSGAKTFIYAFIMYFFFEMILLMIFDEVGNIGAVIGIAIGFSIGYINSIIITNGNELIQQRISGLTKETFIIDLAKPMEISRGFFLIKIKQNHNEIIIVKSMMDKSTYMPLLKSAVDN